MVGKRKTASRLPPRLYEYKGKRGTSYFTRSRDNKHISLGNDLIAAKKKLLELDEQATTLGTIAEMIEDYLNSELRHAVKAGKMSPRTLKDREEQQPHLIKAFGKMHTSSLTSHHVWQYLHKSARSAAAPVRANKEIGFLQVVYSWAKDQQGTIKENPCIGVKRNTEQPRDRLVSDNELAAFMKLAREDGDVSHRHGLAFMLAYLTGKGQAQILNLQRSQITAEGIEFGKRKGGAATLVQWTDKLRAAIDESLAMPSRIAPMCIIHNQDGGRYTSDGFKKGWQLLMGKWVAQGGERFTFHDSRAKAVTTTIESGRKASDLTGHRLEATVSRIYDRRVVRKSVASE